MKISTRATNMTVTNRNDSGSGSLRQALVDGNDGDTITFAVTGTIGLTSGELVVDKSITISGPGPAMLAVSRSSNMPFRIFHVMPDQMVNIEGVTISGGDADIGGGILNDQATLTLTNCSVVNNVAYGSGGGIAGGSLTIIDSTISGNSVFGSPAKGPGLGGGIYAAGTVTISNSTFSDNYILFYGNGAGICNGGTLEIGNTILNADGAYGQNIFNNAGTITSAGYNISNDDGGGYLNGTVDQI